MTMKIELETGSYNERRYGKPWIAVVDFSTNNQGDFKWGEWVGRPGDSGLLILDAEPGDIVARGQKDFRKMRNSAPDWYQLGADGKLESLSDKVSALKASRAWKAQNIPKPAEQADCPRNIIPEV